MLVCCFLVIGFVDNGDRNCFVLFFVLLYMIYFVVGENGNRFVGKGILLGEVYI